MDRQTLEFWLGASRKNEAKISVNDEMFCVTLEWTGG